MNRIDPLRLIAARFWRDERANMSVEFILVAPLLFLWFIGSYLFFDVFKSQSLAAKATYVVGDIMSRQVEANQTAVTLIYDIFDRLLPKAPPGKWMRVSSITYDQAHENYVLLWSYSAPVGAATLLTTETLPLGVLPDMVDGDTVILTETYVPYRPLVDWFNFKDLVWKVQVANRPRFITSVVKTD